MKPATESHIAELRARYMALSPADLVDRIAEEEAEFDRRAPGGAGDHTATAAELESMIDAAEAEADRLDAIPSGKGRSKLPGVRWRVTKLSHLRARLP